MTSDIGTPLSSQRSIVAPGNAILAGGYSGCGESYCPQTWLLGVFVADASSLHAPLVPGESARVAVLRQIRGEDAFVTCTDVWAAEVHRVE